MEVDANNQKTMNKPMEAPILPDAGQAVQFEQFVSEAKTHHDEFLTCATDSLKAALLCGQALIRAREAIERGDWLKALKRYWPEMSKTTAYRYIDIAENSHAVGNLEGKSINSVLRDIGGIEVPATENSGGKAVVLTVEAVERWAQKIKGREETVLSWPDEKRQKLKDALEPAVQLYAILNASGSTMTIDSGATEVV